MLSMIKKIINEKKSFQEAADMILGDDALDDSIILNEDSEDLFAGSEDPEPAPNFEEKKEDDPKDEKPEEKPEEVPAEGGEEPTLPENVPENGEEGNEPVEPPVENPAEPGEVLPTGVGAQTGEPAQTGTDELLSAEIDLGNNTMKDILPTPPSAAADAVQSEDDIMGMRIDSGFEDEREPKPENDDVDIMNMPIEAEECGDNPVQAVPESVVTEAISIGGDGSTPETDQKPEDSTEPAPEGDTNSSEGGEVPPAEEGSEPPAEDNPVTSAVKDKVAEMEAEPAAENDNEASKELLFKKLSNLTKGIEDVKAELLKKVR